MTLVTPDWVRWKTHLIVCADCTAGDVCPAGRRILGPNAGPDDAPWLSTYKQAFNPRTLPPGISNEMPHLPRTERCPRCLGTGKEASAEDFRGEFVHFVHDADVTLRIVESGGALFFPKGIALRLQDEFTKATAYDKLVRLLAQGWSINTELVAGDERRAVVLYAPGREGVFARGMTLEEVLGRAQDI